MNLLFLIFQLIYLLLPAGMANMTPPMAKPLLSKLALSPIDGGLSFRGKALFGSHKTWGGSLMGILAGIAMAYVQFLLYPSFKLVSILDYADWAWIGFLLGLGAIVGDLVKSFMKRQIGIKPGQTWVPFDEIDFLLGSVLLIAPYYFVGWMDFVLIITVGFIFHILVNLLGFYLRIRKKNEIVNLKYHAFADEIFNKEGRLVVGTVFILFSLFVHSRFGTAAYEQCLYLLLAAFLVLDYIRIGLKVHLPLYSQWGKTRFDHDSIHPATFALLGVLIALRLATFTNLLAAFAMYVYADSAAGVIGAGFGKVRLFRKKTMEGSVAMFIFSMLAGSLFIANLSVLFFLALFATILELFLIKLPDSLILPLLISVVGNWL